jgi:DNA processing protein
MDHRELGYLLALIRFPKFGPIRLAKLRGFFDSMETAFRASASELAKAGIDPKIAEQFLAIRDKLSPERELELLERAGAIAVPFTDPNYPELLKEIYDPPAVLFVRGQLPRQNSVKLSVVGSRKISAYGVRAIEKLVEPVASAGVVIVSGLAIGADATAHQATLKVRGATIAVLGSGVNDANIFPNENRRLAQEIIENNGTIVSEFPIGTTPLKQNFPIRNRIIAGISHGTLVIEAAKTSGSLITARAALEAGREVFAVPGPIDSPTSEGANQLIKTGAYPTTSFNDILSVLGLTNLSPSPPGRGVGGEGGKIIPGSQAEADILKILSTNPIHIDDIARALQKNISEISHALTLMEMKGSARHLGNLYYTVG